MIIASDLDRTLIYSNKALEEFGCPLGIDLIPVEYKAGRELSFMTQAAYEALKEISKRNLFVPITTRTTEQFKRIHIFENEIELPFAITTNGAVILMNGEPMEDWTEHISSKMKLESACSKELATYLHSEGFRFEGEIKKVEEFFFYYILEKDLSFEKKLELNKLVSSFGWKVSLQGRKLYFMPNAINKGDALEFICNLKDMKAAAGSGDSILDWDFLKSCRFRLVPTHGELVHHSGIGEISMTKSQGILAGEEILNQFLSVCLC